MVRYEWGKGPVEQDVFIRLNVRRFRELLEAELPEDKVRTIEFLLAECGAKSEDDDPPGSGELGESVRQLVHDVSQPLTAISNYIAACRHLATSEDQQKIQTGLHRAAEQVDRAWDIMRRLRELVASGTRR